MVPPLQDEPRANRFQRSQKGPRKKMASYRYLGFVSPLFLWSYFTVSPLLGFLVFWGFFSWQKIHHGQTNWWSGWLPSLKLT